MGSKVEKKVNANILGKEPWKVLQVNSKESLLAYKGYAVLVDNSGSLSRGEGYSYSPIVKTTSTIQEQIVNLTSLVKDDCCQKPSRLPWSILKIPRERSCLSHTKMRQPYRPGEVEGFC